MEASGINITFTSINSTAYDVSALTLGQGQQIVMSVPSLEGEYTWLSSNDPTLDITANNNEAVILADSVGVSTIQIQDATDTIVKKITITVINEQAVSLGLGAGQVVLK